MLLATLLVRFFLVLTGFTVEVHASIVSDFTHVCEDSVTSVTQPCTGLNAYKTQVANRLVIRRRSTQLNNIVSSPLI